jgi:hypothetical protein
MLLRSVLGGLSGWFLSLPAEEAMERVAVDVALLLRRNLDRSRVLMLLMPASTQRRPSASRVHEDTRHGSRSAGEIAWRASRKAGLGDGAIWCCIGDATAIRQ